ncbi:MAG TPA: AGE family epimerase/isomerase [Bryobacteraceae bacterium]|nr:AGE family epimerase/isomerase [Bryobacteraceae bacterium]
MNRKQELHSHYRRLLLDHIVPFWWRHGIDEEHGGVLSSMTEEGRVLSGDKYIWSQARWLWVCSALYNRVEARPEFLVAARQTMQFLLAHGRDDRGRWVYRTSREGRILDGAISIYSDCFAVYGLSEYYRATKDSVALHTALESYSYIRRRIEQPDFAEVAPAQLPPGRKAHAVPMILTEVSNELGQTSGAREIESAADEYALRVMNHFVRPELGVLLEFLDAAYQPLPGNEGTAVEPGHAIESMWFVLHWARRRGRHDVIRQACEVIRWHLEKGWDEQYGGIYLAIDAKGNPPFLAHAEKKVWWPHTEALYALLLAHELTGAAWCMEWYDRVHAWSFSHFSMPGGEWRQRLDRTGKPITDLIALPVKDPFHLPRAVILILGL